MATARIIFYIDDNGTHWRWNFTTRKMEDVTPIYQPTNGIALN